MVEVVRLELTASGTQIQRTSKLCYTSLFKRNNREELLDAYTSSIGTRRRTSSIVSKPQFYLLLILSLLLSPIKENT